MNIEEVLEESGIEVIGVIRTEKIVQLTESLKLIVHTDDNSATAMLRHSEIIMSDLHDIVYYWPVEDTDQKGDGMTNVIPYQGGTTTALLSFDVMLQLLKRCVIHDKL